MTQVSTFPSTEQGKQVHSLPEQKIQKETILEYLKAYGYDKSLSPEEQSQFIQTSLICDLNPFKREIHIAVYGEGANRKVSIITGYQIYLKRAERTGNLDGWRAWLEGSGQDMKAIVEIFRKDWKHSFTHEVYWEEAVQKRKDGQPTQFWAKQPRFQLRKVAMAQAFRLAFPDELGGLPYESAELPDTEPAGDFSTSAKPQNVKTSISELTTSHAEQTPTNEIPSATAKNNSSQEGNDYRSDTIQHIEDLFEAHPADFTQKHQAWILDKVRKATDKTAVKKMLAYTEKVIRTAA